MLVQKAVFERFLVEKNEELPQNRVYESRLMGV